MKNILSAPRMAVCTIGIASTVTSLLAQVHEEQWPVRFEANGTQYQVFAPQPESMTGNHFTARAAVAMQRTSDKSPLFGAIWGDGVLELDRNSRLAQLTGFNVTDARFPSLTDSTARLQVEQDISAQLPKNTGPISMDWLVSAMDEEKKADNDYANDAPEIVYTEKPSTLVYIDGAPQYEPLPETEQGQGGPAIERVVNTPYLIVRPTGGDNYLYGSGLWFRSRDIQGPWKQEKDVPADLRAIAQRVDSTAAITSTDADGKVPEIVVRTKPAELVDLDGPPQLEPVQNTSLLYVTNTNKNLFMDIDSQRYFLLASGRWFSTADLKVGLWSYVPSNELPAAFASIPEGSKKDDVLVSISGTSAATEAVRDASIPQTAQVDRHSAATSVTYQGSPQFERIDATNVDYATNANTNVLRINGRYYVCDNAVWFNGDTPDGPWTVSTQVPPEVNTVPPSNPMYNLRYVYIYDSTPDIVYVGYTPGYLGCYVQNGCVIYGTGYYYRPWRGYWRPRPFTWGFNMFYDPWYGWGFGYNWGWNWYFPTYWSWGGSHNYGCGWWGPHAYHPVNYARHNGGYYYGHRPDMGGRPRGGIGREQVNSGRPFARPQDLYAHRDHPAGVRASTVPRSGAMPARANASAPTGKGRQPMKPITQDHFTDGRGNVFRMNGGKPQQYGNGSWSRVAQPAPTRQQRPDQVARPQQPAPTARPDMQRAAQPDRDAFQIQQQRERGYQRQQNFQDYQRQGSFTPQRSPAPMRSGGGGSGGAKGGGGGGRGGRR